MKKSSEQANFDINKVLYEEISSKSISSSLGLLINVIFISIAFYEKIELSFLITWVTTITIFLFMRSYDTYKFTQKKATLAIEQLAKRFKYMSMFIVLSVSGGILYVMPNDLSFHQAFLAMVVAGLSAGAAMTLSFYQTLLRVYLIILIFPFATAMLLQNEQLSTLIAILMYFFLILLLLFSKKFYDNILNLIVSRQEIYHQAHFDTVTGLANRHMFYNRLQEEMIKIKRHQTNAALIFIDIDDFKLINDSLGHHIGDEVLKSFAQNITTIIREEDTFARLGGDEFVIILSNLDKNKINAINLSRKIATKLHKQASQVMNIDNNSLHITISIGIKIIDHKKTDINKIIKNADIAMYKSKQEGKNKTSFFQQYMSEEMQEKLTFINEISLALVNNEFEMYYQPIVEIKSNTITSCEALIRWNHPRKGLIYPDSFIPLAEGTDLILKIGKWVLNQVMNDYKTMQHQIENIAINISANHFTMLSFVEELKGLLIIHQVDAKAFKLEITESSFVDNIEHLQAQMKELHTIGFETSLDDFGTGYSSLSYLKNLHFDFLKIDRSFTMNILKNNNDTSLIKMIISIAQQLQMQTIAEGVETQEQLEFLQNLGCTYSQGYLTSKPIPLNDFKNLLTTYNK